MLLHIALPLPELQEDAGTPTKAEEQQASELPTPGDGTGNPSAGYRDRDAGCPSRGSSHFLQVLLFGRLAPRTRA